MDTIHGPSKKHLRTITRKPLVSLPETYALNGGTLFSAKLARIRHEQRRSRPRICQEHVKDYVHTILRLILKQQHALYSQSWRGPTYVSNPGVMERIIEKAELSDYTANPHVDLTDSTRTRLLSLAEVLHLPSMSRATASIDDTSLQLVLPCTFVAMGRYVA